MDKESNQFIHNLARTTAGHLKIPSELASTVKDSKELARKIREIYFEKLKEHSERVRWSSSMLGDMAFGGRGIGASDGVTLYDVHERDWLAQGFTGEALVRIIAITALIAAMADNIWSDFKKGS